jgi:hypothetical protein
MIDDDNHPEARGNQASQQRSHSCLELDVPHVEDEAEADCHHRPNHEPQPEDGGYGRLSGLKTYGPL